MRRILCAFLLSYYLFHESWCSNPLPLFLSSEYSLSCVTWLFLFMESKQWTLLILHLSPMWRFCLLFLLTTQDHCSSNLPL
jgi:hypothetical protein